MLGCEVNDLSAEVERRQRAIRDRGRSEGEEEMTTEANRRFRREAKEPSSIWQRMKDVLISRFGGSGTSNLPIGYSACKFSFSQCLSFVIFERLPLGAGSETGDNGRFRGRGSGQMVPSHPSSLVNDTLVLTHYLMSLARRESKRRSSSSGGGRKKRSSSNLSLDYLELRVRTGISRWEETEEN